MLNKIAEFSKLVSVYAFVTKEAYRSLRGNRRSSHFLTELYLDSLGEKSQLMRVSVADFVPNANSSVFSILGKAHPYLTEGFAEREAFTSSHEICALAAITKALNPKSILEIGTARGGTTFQFWANAPEAEITTLDLVEPQLHHPHIIEAFADSRIRTIRANSREFDFGSLGKKFDLIFIDGGHDYDTVIDDSRNALKVLASGGVILWHDYKPSFPGVFTALNELSREVKLHHLFGTSIAVHRGS